MRRETGFTLIELVMVIVLLSIVATISVQFVALSTQGAIDTADRQQRALKAVVISEQITRMLREAFPLSIREIGTNCIEWLPIVGATRYTRLPPGGGTTIDIVPFYDTPTGEGLRAVVYGYGGSAIMVADSFYSSPLISPGPISPTIDTSVADTTTITLTESHRFGAQSPTQRLFMVSRPHTLCSEGSGGASVLALYRDYDIGDSYTEGSRDILAANLSDSAEFVVSNATLRRSAVISFSFELSTPGSSETLDVSQEVQIRNVP